MKPRAVDGRQLRVGQDLLGTTKVEEAVVALILGLPSPVQAVALPETESS